jgi:2-(1,2-epoxy-1,2-dihydrophenyl)acetyl-CoA isomerase
MSDRLARELYRALAEGDRAALDALLHKDFVGRTTAGLPLELGGEYIGSEAMRKRFWGRIAQHFEVRAEPARFTELPDGRLLVEGRYVGTARATGRKLDAEFTHTLSFADRRIVELVQLTDSDAWVGALGRELTAVEFDIADGLGQLRLNRPDHGNAFSMALAEDLYEVAVRCTDADRLRALLVTGNGPRFSVGGDMDEFRRGGPGGMGRVMQEMARRYHAALELYAELPVPVVCGVHGAVAGGALGMTFVSDIVLAAERTKFALGFAAIGIAGDSANSWFLPRLIGPRRTAELYFEQRVLTATEAAEWGLVTRVVPATELHDQSLALALRLANGPTVAYGEFRALLRQTWGNSLPEQLAAEVRALGVAGNTEDAEAAVSAFLAKQRPTFQGS